MRGWLIVVAATWAAALAADGAAAAPSDRGWELVSPAVKLGNDVMAETSRTRAAAHEAPGLPMAVTFASLGGFADVQGMGVSTEYLAQRTAQSGTSGWATHAITPAQQPLTLRAAAQSLDPLYEGDMADDLSTGVFRAWSPLTDAANVAQVENLYAREDLRVPGAGTYRLLTDALAPLAPIALSTQRPYLAGASRDFEHVLYESRQPLAGDAAAGNTMLYKADHGVVRRVTAGSPACPPAQLALGANPATPCEIAGAGTAALRRTDRAVSDDGARVSFTTPVSSTGNVSARPGAVSRLYQLDDRGTIAAADDAVVQLDASERAVPEPAQAATFQTASRDGARVFFTSTAQLTDEPLTGVTGLYLWERQATDEVQQLDVDATGGTFALTFHTQPSVGTGTLTAGSATVGAVEGSFTVGQAIAGAGVEPGTTVVAVGNFTTPATSTVTLSQPAAASGTSALSASLDATTAPLPHDASAAQVQAALEGLRGIGAGNVAVDGSGPYAIRFQGALAGVDVAELTADGASLTGGASTAAVATTHALRNLELLASAAVVDVAGASDDGRRLYFVAPGQLLAGGPAVAENGVYLWDDMAGATLSFVGGISIGDANANVNAYPWNQNPKVSRVTPDGGHLLFEVSGSDELAPGSDHGSCPAGNPNAVGNGACSQLYLYDAAGSAPLAPDVVCVSCAPGGRAATSNALLNAHVGSGASQVTWRLNRALSDDGRRVFFSTADALVPEDVNARYDAYEYDAPSGTARLVSSGRDAADSWFLDASADGDDVFFVTRARLVGWDVDQAYDLYDARAGGGLPEPPGPPIACAGEDCRGPARAAPPPPLLGSVTFAGQGNARAAKPRARPRARRRARACRRGFVRKRVKGRRRCVRRSRR